MSDLKTVVDFKDAFCDIVNELTKDVTHENAMTFSAINKTTEKAVLDQMNAVESLAEVFAITNPEGAEEFKTEWSEALRKFWLDVFMVELGHGDVSE